MSRTSKLLIIASCAIILGLIIFGGVMTVFGWDFSKLSTAKYETNSYEIKEDFENISIDATTADITLKPTDKSEVTVECVEQKNLKYAVSAMNGTLTIELEDTRKWYEKIGIGFKSNDITVYLPDKLYGELKIDATTGDVEVHKGLKFTSADIEETTGDINFLAAVSESLKIKATTGDITVSGVTAGALNLSVTTGDVTVKNVTCVGNAKITVTTGDATVSSLTADNLTSVGTTGKITLKSTVASGKLNIERSTGSVVFDGSDAEEIFVKVTTGSIRGSLLSGKNFSTDTTTGSVSVPSSTSGGTCQLKSTTGSIKITIEK